ncbi:MAG TPA: sulfatase-like hydrolase/transferase [Thermoanaerobaculia bacterium]
MRRVFHLLLAVAALGCGRAPETASSAASFPNAPVILISIDTLRSDRLPAYGYDKVETPHLDALARDSVVFQRAYSHCPMTLPSHASIFTGLLPTEHGVRNNVGYSFDASRHRTLAATLQERGYRTGAAVSSYVLRSDTGIAGGFADYDDSIPVASGALGSHQRSGFDTLNRATAWLDGNASQPFFYFFHIYEPHAPYTPPAEFSKYADPYDGEVAASDAIVGRLLEHLKKLGVYDRALIVLLSDHGEGLWDHGEDQHGILLYRESLQVPLFVKLPKQERAGTKVARPVGLASVYQTILGLPGSLLDEPQEKAPAAPIYAETFYPRIHLGWSELRSLIDDQHHYIDGPRPELYDIAADPRETRDVLAEQRRVTAAMRQKIAAYPKEIAALAPVDPEEAAKLAALGYVGSPQDRSGPLPNPRDMIGSLREIKQAFALADARRYDEAVDALRALLAQNPRNADVASKLGEVLVDSGRYEEAVTSYQTAIAHAHRFSPDLALGLGLALLRAGRPAETLKHADVALKASPREAHELLARALIELRRAPEAESHARAAIALGDRQPSSLLLLADVQRAAGQYAEALRTVDEATQRAAELGVQQLYGADYLRGDLYARMDRPAEAEAAYRREIAAFPQHLQSYANLAIVHLIQGNPAEADRTLDEMVRRNPHRGAREMAARTRAAMAE